MSRVLLGAFLGTGFTFLMTVLGAAVVFLFKSRPNPWIYKLCLGFASGIMIAASIWSLLIPALEQEAWMIVTLGFLFGGAFLVFSDHLLFRKQRKMGREKLLAFAVTLHNIPEGMAVGLAFARAGHQGTDLEAFMGAILLAIGIGIQNLPEGAAVSLPLKESGMGRGKAFLYGFFSAVVEPVFGLMVVFFSDWIRPMMPAFLAFAAGAMIYVVVDELIPAANIQNDSKAGTIGCFAGFLLMMVLDVALSA